MRRSAAGARFPRRRSSGPATFIAPGASTIPPSWPRCSRSSAEAGGRVAGPAAEALLANQLDQGILDWLKANYFKTELELGHCLRTPAEGPCECDLYLRCSKFFTTSEYAPRLRARLIREQQLIQDAVERGWPREAERHTAISGRICELLAELGESAAPDTPGT